VSQIESAIRSGGGKGSPGRRISRAGERRGRRHARAPRARGPGATATPVWLARKGTAPVSCGSAPVPCGSAPPARESRSRRLEMGRAAAAASASHLCWLPRFPLDERNGWVTGGRGEYGSIWLGPAIAIPYGILIDPLTGGG
jgi:hypothetical protein